MSAEGMNICATVFVAAALVAPNGLRFWSCLLFSLVYTIAGWMR